MDAVKIRFDISDDFYRDARGWLMCCGVRFAYEKQLNEKL